MNRTRILASRETITVRHGPLPWLGNKELEASNCTQFYRDEKESHSSRGGTTRTYGVYVSTCDGRTVKSLDGLTGLTNEQALSIAQQLEEYMGIQRRPGEGEIFALGENAGSA